MGYCGMGTITPTLPSGGVAVMMRALMPSLAPFSRNILLTSAGLPSLLSMNSATCRLTTERPRESVYAPVWHEKNKKTIKHTGGEKKKKKKKGPDRIRTGDLLFTRQAL